jgi:hypothetical protein
VNPPSGQTSLLLAMSNLQDGDEIKFNIPGAGPHYILTPPEGYPLVTKSNVVIDGTSQPGAVANSNPILGGNNAKIQIVLDSRNGNSRLLDFAGDDPADGTGYGDTESAVIGVYATQGFVLRGVSILAVPLTGPDNGVALYGVSFAKGASGQVSGCWIGLDPDGKTIAAPVDGLTGFRYKHAATGDYTNIDNVVLGVPKTTANAAADANILVGIPAIPIIIEGSATRIAGNYFGVLPDGKTDVNMTAVPENAGNFEGYIEIGRAGNNTLIGTDGDGVNDANERNVFGGTLPDSMGGYDHSIEFYGQNPGTNIVIAGNYIGVGVDGATRVTNGVPAINAAGGSAQYRIGSNLDGVSDDIEGNVIANYWPASVFPPATYLAPMLPNGLNFFDELSISGIYSLRGNTLMNDLPSPVSPTKADAGEDGLWRTNFYAKALVDATAGVVPVIDPSSTATRLKGTVPAADKTTYPTTIVDLYTADAEGIATGKATDSTAFPQGFVQGRKYLGSFVVDGPQDLNSTESAFEFDIASLNLTGENLLTVTANYSQGTATEKNAIVLTSPFSDTVLVTGTPAGELKFTSINLTAGSVKMEWTGGGKLQQSAQATSGWEDVPGNPPTGYTTPASGPMKYYRLVR